jgi:hypothetical protein
MNPTSHARISLSSLILLTLGAGLGMAAFKYANETLAMWVFSGTLLVLLFSVIAALAAREPLRSPAIGFAVAGCAYTFVAFGPWTSIELSPQLLPHRMIHALHLNMAGYSSGDAVEIEWNGGWYPGVILETKDGSYKIHYDGHGNEWDEWLGTARLRTKISPHAIRVGHCGVALILALAGAFFAALVAAQRRGESVSATLTTQVIETPQALTTASKSQQK